MLIKNLNLHIRRFEFKYLIEERRLDKLRRSISNFVEIDPFAKELKSNFYPVTSLYFDDLDFNSYYEKLAGLKLKRKFRLRVYGTKPTRRQKAFMEIKRRDDAIVFKDRFVSNIENLKLILNDGRYDLLPQNDKVSNLFVHLVRRKGLRPVVLISYKREAYFDKDNSFFRLTIDQDLVARKNYDIDFDASTCNAVLPGLAVVEAKFNRIMPAWFGMIIKSYNLNRVSFSKYCFSLESCGIVSASERSSFPQTWIY